MLNEYPGVITRFLCQDERLIISDENEMPLVIEAKGERDIVFLQTFLEQHSKRILEDIAKFGAVLLRGFAIESDEDFERSVLKINGFRGISDAFMSEEGRTHVGNLQYVLHTNSVYKTGGTLYLGGFHTENYYSTDVPSYICFCCLKPSIVGGETGLINMQKIYHTLSPQLQQKLEKNTFFIGKWLISEVTDRYHIPAETIEKICLQFNLPMVGEGSEKFILMYKPSVFVHPITHEKALQINLFELPTLNAALRKCFMDDYQGKTWFWHRLVWRLPAVVFKFIERIAVALISFFHSPKESLHILKLKWDVYKALKKNKSLAFEQIKVGSCFDEADVKELAKSIRKHYSSCLWQKGDILLVDNRKVAHAGMPGAGPRQVRALICNPVDMTYSSMQSGLLDCCERETETVGYYMEKARNLISSAHL